MFEVIYSLTKELLFIFKKTNQLNEKAICTDINASNRNKQSKNQEEQKFENFRDENDSEVNKLLFWYI